jgi:hypothetical protein
LFDTSPLSGVAMSAGNLIYDVFVSYERGD